MFHFNTCKNDQKRSEYANELFIANMCCPWFWGFIIKTLEILNGKVILLIEIILKIFTQFWIGRDLRHHLVNTPYFIKLVPGLRELEHLFMVTQLTSGRHKELTQLSIFFTGLHYPKLTGSIFLFQMFRAIAVTLFELLWRQTYRVKVGSKRKASKHIDKSKTLHKRYFLNTVIQLPSSWSLLFIDHLYDYFT